MPNLHSAAPVGNFLQGNTKIETIESDHSIAYEDIVFREQLKLVNHTDAGTGRLRMSVFTRRRCIREWSICEIKVEKQGGVSDHIELVAMDNRDIAGFESDWATLWHPDIDHLDSKNYEFECADALKKLADKYKKLFTAGKTFRIGTEKSALQTVRYEKHPDHKDISKKPKDKHGKRKHGRRKHGRERHKQNKDKVDKEMTNNNKEEEHAKAVKAGVETKEPQKNEQQINDDIKDDGGHKNKKRKRNRKHRKKGHKNREKDRAKEEHGGQHKDRKNKHGGQHRGRKHRHKDKANQSPHVESVPCIKVHEDSVNDIFPAGSSGAMMQTCPHNSGANQVIFKAKLRKIRAVGSEK